MENTNKQYQVKLDSHNHITLHKVEEKMYTREEMIAFGSYMGNYTKGQESYVINALNSTVWHLE